MNIAALSTELNMIETQNQIGVALLSKAMDNMEVTGDGMVKMMEQSVNPAVGQNVDIYV